MIQFTCPCGKGLHAGDDQAGRSMRCPDCGREIAIPGGEGVQTADAPTPVRRLAVVSAVLGLLAVALSGITAALLVRATDDAACILLSIGGCSLLSGLSAVLIARCFRVAGGRGNGPRWSKRLFGVGTAAGILNSLVLVFVVAAILGFLLVCESAYRIPASMNLEKIGMAMYSYNADKGTLPPAAIRDADGQPLLSWRVAILPYLGRDDLYQMFHLDEPWDGPNNSKLLPQMPKEYVLSIDSSTPPGYTYLRVFVGNGAAFDADRGVRLDEFTDGRADTILAAEAATAVPWTKPDELPYDPDGPLPALGGHFGRPWHNFVVLLGDGSLRAIRQDVHEQTLRAAITRSGHDALGPDW